MKLGNFSLSLTVKDLPTSRDFYNKLGFKEIGGDGESWQILRNDQTVLGLFQGMFESNIMTFNPGWDIDQNQPESFTDVRELRDQCIAQGLQVSGDQTQESKSGPAHFMLTDPDGNTILIDQHV